MKSASAASRMRSLVAAELLGVSNGMTLAGIANILVGIGRGALLLLLAHAVLI